MNVKPLNIDLSVCKLLSLNYIDINSDFFFVCKTDEEVSLVCPTERVPEGTSDWEDGWKAFRIQGVLNFSLIGVIARISTLLAKNNIGTFVVSTYNTDYVLVKSNNLEKSLTILESDGFIIEK